MCERLRGERRLRIAAHSPCLERVDELLAAGNFEHGSRHVRVGHEEDCGVPNVVDRTDATRGERLARALEELRAGGFVEKTPHVAVDEAGADRVHANWPELDGERARERF